MGAMFTVTVKLTLEGMSNWKKIIQCIFQYLLMVKHNGVEQWRYTELVAVSQLAFQFQEEQDPGTYTEELALKLQVRSS